MELGQGQDFEPYFQKTSVWSLWAIGSAFILSSVAFFVLFVDLVPGDGFSDLSGKEKFIWVALGGVWLGQFIIGAFLIQCGRRWGQWTEFRPLLEKALLTFGATALLAGVLFFHREYVRDTQRAVTLSVTGISIMAAVLIYRSHVIANRVLAAFLGILASFFLIAVGSQGRNLSSIASPVYWLGSSLGAVAGFSLLSSFGVVVAAVGALVGLSSKKDTRAISCGLIAFGVLLFSGGLVIEVLPEFSDGSWSMLDEASGTTFFALFLSVGSLLLYTVAGLTGLASGGMGMMLHAGPLLNRVRVASGLATKPTDARQCGKCSVAIPAGSQFCGNCGTKYEPPVSPSNAFRHCLQCGTDLPQGARFCGKCGTRLPVVA